MQFRAQFMNFCINLIFCDLGNAIRDLCVIAEFQFFPSSYFNITEIKLSRIMMFRLIENKIPHIKFLFIIEQN